MPRIEISNLHFGYTGHTVLRDINLTIGNGTVVSLLGPSGCGKSTLLRLVAGLALPTSGRITLDGAPITGPGLDRGVVFQDYSLFPWMTVGENVVLALKQAVRGKTRAELVDLARSYLEMVNLPGVFDKLPKELSGGMRQRGAIARTLAVGSPVLLLDEPFGALDPVNRLRLQDLLQELLGTSQPRKTVLFVTHDVEEAILLGERVIVLGGATGSVLADLPVPFQRPRRRQDIYASAEFSLLRNTVFEAYHRDIRASMEAEALVSSSAEGI